jgi:predicted metal-dependent hydrolase
VLSFNWRLVLAPSPVLRYVVVHELCHLREPNHSRAFWSLVGDALPGFEAERAWLRRHGHELLAYRPMAGG